MTGWSDRIRPAEKIRTDEPEKKRDKTSEPAEKKEESGSRNEGVYDSENRDNILGISE